MRAVVADGQLRDEDQQLLPLGENLLTEGEQIGELLPHVLGLLLQGIGALVEDAYSI